MCSRAAISTIGAAVELSRADQAVSTHLELLEVSAHAPALVVRQRVAILLE